MSRFDRNWHVHSTATLPSGDRVFVAHIRSGHKWSTAAVLMVEANRLSRLYRGGRRALLAKDFLYPDQASWDADLVLRDFAPKHWGSQRLSMCVIQKIPDRLLAAETQDLARLLLAWFRVEQRSKFSAIRRNSFTPRAPAKPARQPVAISIIPNTDVVVRALHDGVLLDRLKLGLERIYVSEYALIRAPKISVSIRALEKRFPERFVIVPFSGCASSAIIKSLQLRRQRAAEFATIGSELSGAYQDDFGFDKFTSPKALDDIFCLRIGDIPRGIRLLITHELTVPYRDWAPLDIGGMQALEERSLADFWEQEQRGIDRLLGKEN